MRHRENVKASWRALHHDFLVTSRPWACQVGAPSGRANALWPFTVEHYSRLRPTFLEGWATLDLKEKNGTWLIREGVAPVAWYFANHPIPERGFEGRILVHESVAPAIPGAWKRHVGIYRLESLSAERSSSKERFRQIILGSVLSEEFCSLGALNGQLDRLVSQLGTRNFAKAEVSCCFHSAGIGGKGTFPSWFMRLVRQKVRQGVRLMRWEDLVAKDSFSGAHAVELTDQLLFADSGFLHLTLSLGARLIDVSGRVPPQGGVFEPLSPHHGYRVWPTFAAYQRRFSAI